jgi:hypothetical protein
MEKKAASLKVAFLVNRLRELGEPGREGPNSLASQRANQLGKRMRSRSGDGTKGEE